MKILYTPTIACKAQDPVEQNIIYNYHAMFLDVIAEIDLVQEVLYLPHGNADVDVNAMFSKPKYRIIANLTEANQTDLMVTDLSNLAFSYALFYKKPVIYFLPGFTGVDIAEQNDQLFQLLGRFCYFCHSNVQLRETIEDMPKIWESGRVRLEKFVDEALI